MKLNEQAVKLHARRSIFSVLGIAIVSSALAGCGGATVTRSSAAYCSYFYGEGTRLHNRFINSTNASGQDPFARLSSVFADIPEAASFLHQLSLRAPQEIAPDVQALAKALDSLPSQAAGAASNPLGALASAFASSVETHGAEQRVNEYTLKHCGVPPGATSNPSATPAPPPGAAPTAAATAPAGGATLLSTTVSGQAHVVTSGHGFAIVTVVPPVSGSNESPRASVTTYNAAGQQLGKVAGGDLMGECGAADVDIPGHGSAVLTEVITTHPAEGIKPASSSLMLDAWNATTAQPMWSTVMSTTETEPTCHSSNGELENFASTQDGRWGVYGSSDPNSGGAEVVNLETGKLSSGVRAEGVLGNFVVALKSEEGPWRTISPTSGRPLGIVPRELEIAELIGLSSHHEPIWSPPAV